jgi:uncharacterized protein (DUF736 family)
MTVSHQPGRKARWQNQRINPMVSIGYVTKQSDGSFTGTHRTLTINCPITMKPVRSKSNDRAPDFRITGPNNQEIGAGWKKISQADNEYIRVSFEAPEFGARRLYANLG